MFIRGAAGDPLPVVFRSLADAGTLLLRGQLCLICSGPGTGKSALTLTYALRARVPTLYFSADSDPFIQLSRSISILSGYPMAKSQAMVGSGEFTADALDDIPIRFNYNASPTLSDIELQMESFYEVYGDYPALVVVDNITNVCTDLNEDDPFAGLEVLMEYLHKMARNTGAFVIGLHHVTGPYNDAAKPIPLSGVKGQITRVPEMVLTLHRVRSALGGADTINVSTVKNRAGRQDPSGNTFVGLTFDGDRMQIRDRQ